MAVQGKGTSYAAAAEVSQCISSSAGAGSSQSQGSSNISGATAEHATGADAVFGTGQQGYAQQPSGKGLAQQPLCSSIFMVLGHRSLSCMYAGC